MSRTFLIVLFLWLFTVLLQAQTHTHVGNDLARFRLIRLTAPAKITNVEPNESGQKIEYVSWDRLELENGSFQVSKAEKLKKGDWYFISYCGADYHVYGIYKLTQEQMKGIPTKN